MDQTETTVCIYRSYEEAKIKRIDSLRDRYSGQHKVSQNVRETNEMHRICLLQRYLMLFLTTSIENTFCNLFSMLFFCI